jgi:hypothetical protein
MVSFKIKNSNVGKFWRALDGKMFNGHLGYFMTI